MATSGSSEISKTSSNNSKHTSEEDREILALQDFLQKLEEALGGPRASKKETGETERAEVSGGPKEVVSSIQEAEIASEAVQDSNRVVFVKDNVAIRPASSNQEYLSGCLCLLWKESSLVMTWLPYPPRDNTDYDFEMAALEGNAIKEVAISDFHSVRRFAPALAYHYLIVALKSGLALQPLYFLSGGVKDFLRSLQMHAALTRSKENKDKYLVNLVRDPLRKSLTQLGLPEAVAPKKLSSLRPRDTWVIVGEEGDQILEESAMPEEQEQEKALVNTPKNTKTASKSIPKVEDIALNVLEKLTFVTKFARDTGSQLIAGFTEEEPEIRKQLKGFTEPTGKLPGRPVRGNWSSGSKGLQKQTTSSDVEGDSSDRERQPPLGLEEWHGMLDGDGRVKDPENLRKRVFFGGMEPSLRPEVWKFLLGYHPFSSSRAERELLKEKKALEYAALREKWQGVNEEEAKSREGFHDQLNAVEKDVTRTDPKLPFYEGDNNPNVSLLRSILITYAFFNPDLSYCQGMCDLLSPILYIMRDEAESFWCFCSLMERNGLNFRMDQNGMQLQLAVVAKLVQLLDPPLHAYFRAEDCLNYFFCFRWIFLQFKRDFSFDEILSLWEKLWTRYPSAQFHLFMCVAILQEHFTVIQDEQMDFESILWFVNDLSGQVDLVSTIASARNLHFKLCELLKT